MALTRFGVAMETSLLAQLDQLVEQRRTTRSEILRDLARAEIIRSLASRRVEAFASVTIVYNHHVRELSERITEMQHALGDQVRSAMHVHLDAERCLEVIVMRGRADRLQTAAEQLFATRGVLQGSIEIVAEATRHAHEPEGEHGHAHAEHESDAGKGTAARTRKRKRSGQ
jgi:CopG family transcriptional regulator, nickel-responsive regulator